MITATVKGFDHFDEVTDQVEQICVEALNAAAREGAQVASAIAARRSDTGTMATMHVVAATGDIDGYTSGFRSAAWYAVFQNFGTLVSRRRRVSAATLRRRSSGSGQARLAKNAGASGITPLRFFDAGRREGRRRLLAEIAKRV